MTRPNKSVINLKIMSVKENLENLQNRIKEAAQKVARNPDEIELVAVTKLVDINQIREAINAGINIIGENRVQEAKSKFSQLKTYDVKWHLVGHLQRNKVRDAIAIFDMIQSVDRIELADEIDKRAGQVNKMIDILIQVNVSGEESKFGVSPSSTIGIIQQIAKFKNIRIKGLMTIAPLVSKSEDVRPYFMELAKLMDKIARQKIENVQMKYLSMGMSNDFEVAIEEGSNMIRIGRAIFTV
ncbi:MAG: YggS family pyridoxal phosphate-dependent enzyme [bacterium]